MVALIFQVIATITGVDLFEGSRQFTYNDTVDFVVISLQQCVVTKECEFDEGLCDWQITSPIVLTTASAVGIPSRNSGEYIHQYLLHVLAYKFIF